MKMKPQPRCKHGMVPAFCASCKPKPQPRCKHGMVPAFCASCKPKPPPKLKPKATPKVGTVHAKQTVSSAQVNEIGFLVVGVTRNHPSHRNLGPGIRVVYVQGTPFLWLIKLIVDRCPNLRKIQVRKSAMAKFGDSHRKVLDDAGVQLENALLRPELAWAGTEIRPTKEFDAQREFLLSLEGEQRKLWDEMVEFGFEEIDILTEYYGLGDGEPVAQTQLIEKYGYSSSGAGNFSAIILGMIRYLDPNFQCGRISIRYAKSFQLRVRRIRKIFRQEQALSRFTESLGLDRLPAGISPSDFENLEIIAKARRNGKLAELWQEKPQLHQILQLRYGIGANTGPIPDKRRTLYEVAEDSGLNYSREWIRRLQNEALDWIQEVD